MKKNLSLYAFIAPSLLLAVMFFLLPLGQNVVISVSNWNAIKNTGTFVGWDNFIAAFTDPVFIEALGTTAAYTVMVVPLLLLFGLILALLVTNDRMFGVTAFKVIYFVPWVIPWLTAGLIWKFMYNDSFGLINYGLMTLGIVSEPVQFFNDKWTAILAVIGVCLWKTLGYNMVILLTGLKSIPATIYEAAEVDGSGGLHRFLNITLPLLKPGISLMVIMSVLGSFLAFDHFWIVTRGAPSHSTETILTWLYQTSFTQFNLGKGSAMSMVLLGITGVFAYLQIRLFNVLALEK